MKKLKKFVKIGAIILGVLLILLLVANAIFISITGSRLEKRLAAIRAAGDPVTLADLKRPLPPPDQNAATYLSRAQEDARAFSKETDPVVWSDPPRPYEDKIKAVRAGFAAYPRLLPLLQEAADCPNCNLGLPYDADPREFIDELMKGPQRFRVSASILSWQARLLRHDGKLDEAMRTCLTSLSLSRQLDREPPMMITALVVIACQTVALEDANDILRTGVVSPAVRADLDKVLALLDDAHAFTRVLKNERALSISHFGTVLPVGWFNRGIMNAWECGLLDATNEQLDLVLKPYAQAADAVEQKKTPTQFDLFSSLSLPSYLKVRGVCHRTQAYSRCLRIVNVMQQKGVWKDNEIQLSALGLPAETILDPFDGSSIKLRKTNGDWVLYSIGANLKDDGGDLASNLDVGLGPIPVTRR